MRLRAGAFRFGLVLILVLSGCTLQTPDTYSTEYDRTTGEYTGDGYKPLVVAAEVKGGFEKLLLDKLCKGAAPPRPPETSPEKQCSIQGKISETDPACWTSRHYEAKWCADNVTRYTIDQCAVLVGGQNRYAGRFAEVMLPFLAAIGVASDIAAATAVAAKGNTAAAAVTAAIIAGSGNVQKVIPSTTSVKASDLTTSETGYLLISHFDGKGLPCSDKIPACKTNDLIYSGLHDAILSSCPALNP